MLKYYKFKFPILDIIGTIDNKIEVLNKIINLVNNHSIFIYKTAKNNLISIKNLVNVKTGKEDANHATKNGKFPFFTCASEPFYCDDFNFDNESILIAGNGSFQVSHYNGKFNAYQRTYVLQPYNTINYGLVYFGTLLYISNFIKKSAGSIIKFITIDDIYSIKIKQLPSKSLETLYNNLLLIDSLKYQIRILNNYKILITKLLLTREII